MMSQDQTLITGIYQAMANYNPATDHLKDTRWQSGESGNPNGKPKGAKHLSTWIREIMEDEDFECKLADGTLIKGAPIRAIVNSMIIKTLNGDARAFDLVGKYGYGTKINLPVEDRDLPTPILGGLSQRNSLEGLVVVVNRPDKDNKNDAY